MCIRAAAALKKVVTPSGDKGKQKGFHKSHPQRNGWAARVASPQQTNQGKK